MTDSMIAQWRADKYAPLWRCVYCGETNKDQLTDEHIIPFGLLPKGGDWFLPKSSCKACADITKKFENQVLGEMFGPLRQQLMLKTRNRGSRFKKSGRMIARRATRDGRVWDEEISVSSFPKLCIGFRWPAPGILFDEVPNQEFKGELVVRYDKGDFSNAIRADEGFKIGRIDNLAFARMLAKIAHCYAVARCGADSFEPMLPPLILGKISSAQYFVGGDLSIEPPDQSHLLHDMYPVDCRRDNGPVYLGVALRLFAMIGMPRYHIVVGRRLKQAPITDKPGDIVAVQFPFPRS
jgi:hypothetical protein